MDTKESKKTANNIFKNAIININKKNYSLAQIEMQKIFLNFYGNIISKDTNVLWCKYFNELTDDEFTLITKFLLWIDLFPFKGKNMERCSLGVQKIIVNARREMVLIKKVDNFPFPIDVCKISDKIKINNKMIARKLDIECMPAVINKIIKSYVCIKYI